MSLFSYLNSDSYGSSATSMQVGLAIQQAMAKLEAQQTTTSSATANGASQSGAVITVEAKRAAAAKADASKDAATLAAETRQALDTQYEAAGAKDSADLTTLSGRALSIMALNESGAFSKTEIAAAKLELRAWDRQAAMSQLMAGPLTAASLATYQKDQLTARASMSTEEQHLRDINPKLR